MNAVLQPPLATPVTDAAQPGIDPALFRAVMGQFATGVTAISFLADGAPAAMTANAFMSVSLSPPLVLVSVRRASRFVDHVGLGQCYGVGFLHQGQQALSAHFGGRPVPELPPPFIDGGPVPLIAGALAHIVAEVVDIHAAGDHLLYIGRVQQLTQGPPAAPLVFSAGQYRQLQPPSTTAQPRCYWDSNDGW